MVQSFIDREYERDVFERILNRQIEARVLDIRGAAGIGKTWLLRNFYQQTLKRDIPVSFMDFSTEHKSPVELMRKIVDELNKYTGRKTFSEFIDEDHLFSSKSDLQGVVNDREINQISIPPLIYERLRTVLLNCGPFRSNDEIKALLIDQRLSLWQDQLPEANSALARVEAIISFFGAKHNRYGENGLILLLQALCDRLNPIDACYSHLIDLIEQLGAYYHTQKKLLHTTEMSGIQKTPTFSERLPSLLSASEVKFVEKKLTQLFVRALTQLMEFHSIVMLFDSMEHISVETSEWIINNLLSGLQRGQFESLVLVFAGRPSGYRPVFEFYENGSWVIICDKLTKFELKHTKEYLDFKGIHLKEDEIELVHRATCSTPLALAMVAHNLNEHDL